MADKLGTIVYVEWLDSTRTDGWQEPRDVEDLTQGDREMACWSVGLLMSEADDRIVIATSTNPARQALSPLVIPRRAITRIRKTTVEAVFGPARKGGKE